MYASHTRRLRRHRGAPAHGGAARKRAPASLLCFVGAILLVASSRHNALPKVPFLGSFWRDSSAPGAYYTPTPRPHPHGVKYELHTLPVDAKAVADGDTITVYVDADDHREPGNVPRGVREAAAERTKARAAKNHEKAVTLQKIIVDAGYRQVPDLTGEQVLAKKYRVRLRGIDAPENSMRYGREAKEELVKLVQGRTLKISIYDTDRYGRLVADVDCNGIFVQEHMLKKGLTWHYSAYDQRPELAEWEKQARASGLGLWALPNPEKPWEWRKE
ncbi:putative staphylococcal-like nuclease CAN1 [Hordeum vulgare]|nr:putative staphylococcal-like nuclease CAN1 [Hordeum vulgare]